MTWGQYNASLSEWTEERCELLRKLWCEQGLTATKCAAILGEGLTRNAIIGKVHRLKFPKRKSGTAGLNWSKGDKPASPKRRGLDRVPGRAVRIRRAEIIEKQKLEIVAVKTKPEVEEEFAVDLAALSAPAWEPLPGTEPLALHELPNHGLCRWPVGTEAPYKFCGCASVPGGVYCATHRQRSVGHGTISEQSAHRVKNRHLEIA